MSKIPPNRFFDENKSKVVKIPPKASEQQVGQKTPQPASALAPELVPAQEVEQKTPQKPSPLNVQLQPPSPKVPQKTAEQIMNNILTVMNKNLDKAGTVVNKNGVFQIKGYVKFKESCDVIFGEIDKKLEEKKLNNREFYMHVLDAL